LFERNLGVAATIAAWALVGGNQINTPDQIEAWRRDLKAKITWALVVKFLALILLWLLFFRMHGS
jgi:hypothetical protein